MPAFGADVVAAALAMPTRVAGLVWVDTYRTLGTSRSRAKVDSFLAPFRADFEGATESMVRGMFLPSSDPTLVNWVAADMAAAPPEVALDALEHALTFEPAVLTALGDLTMPLVAINSNYQPNDVDALRRNGVKEAVLISGVGHFVMMEDPVTFNRLLAATVEEFAALTRH